MFKKTDILKCGLHVANAEARLKFKHPTQAIKKHVQVPNKRLYQTVSKQFLKWLLHPYTQFITFYEKNIIFK